MIFLKIDFILKTNKIQKGLFEGKKVQTWLNLYKQA